MSQMGQQCQGRHILTDGGVAQDLPFPPGPRDRVNVAEGNHST